MKTGRPKSKNPKKQLNITINKELNVALTEFAEDNELSKSEYIEYLIKQDINKKLLKIN